MNIKLGNREKIIIGAAGLVLLVAAWFILVFQTLNRKVDKARAEIVEIKRDLSASENAPEVIMHLRAEIDSLRANLRKGQDRILRKDQISYIAQEFEQLADQHNLVVEEIKLQTESLFSGPVEGNVFMTLPVSLEMTGQFFEFGRFLESLPDVPFLVKPGQIYMGTGDALYPNIGIELVVYVYVYQ